MKANLRVTNVVATGKLPTEKKIDIKKVVTLSKWTCQIVNEMISPILQIRFKRSDEINIHKKVKSACISIWPSGTVNIVGVTSLEEAEKYYERVVKELIRIGVLG